MKGLWRLGRAQGLWSYKRADKAFAQKRRGWVQAASSDKISATWDRPEGSGHAGVELGKSLDLWVTVSCRESSFGILFASHSAEASVAWGWSYEVRKFPESLLAIQNSFQHAPSP